MTTTLPQIDLDETPPAPGKMEWLVSPRTGLVTQLSSATIPDDAPADYLCTVAHVADMRYSGAWLSDRIAAGTSFGNREKAQNAAIGEAVERYCGNYIPHNLRIASPAELTAENLHHWGPDHFPSWLPEQLQHASFPYERFTSHTSVPWVQGSTWEGTACLVPASWVYLNFYHGPYRDVPRINHVPYTGIATGLSVTDAALRGLAECVERDAFVTWWMLDLPMTPVDWRSIPTIHERFKHSPLDVRLVHLPSDLPLPTIAALIWDEKRQVPAAGFSAHENPTVAAEKAVEEALQVWCASVGLLDPEGPSWQAVAGGIFHPLAYLPYRADRAYLQDAGTNYSNIRDLAAQTQLWLDPAMHHLLDRFGTDTNNTCSIQDIPTGCRHSVIDSIGADNLVVCDLTTPDIIEVGLRTVRVLAPSLQPNVPAAIPYLDSPRLRTVAQAHRGAAAVISVDTVELAPPPHN